MRSARVQCAWCREWVPASGLDAHLRQHIVEAKLVMVDVHPVLE